MLFFALFENEFFFRLIKKKTQFSDRSIKKLKNMKQKFQNLIRKSTIICSFKPQASISKQPGGLKKTNYRVNFSHTESNYSFKKLNKVFSFN
jgi:UDP-N-acetylglucosamine:LPS N-acetylglucosamine transferase